MRACEQQNIQDQPYTFIGYFMLCFTHFNINSNFTHVVCTENVIFTTSVVRMLLPFLLDFNNVAF